MRDSAVRAVAGLGAVAVLLGAFAAVAAPADAGGADATSSGAVLDRAAPAAGYETIRLGIEVRPDASARWTIQYRYDLTSEAVERAFERTAANLTNPPGVFLDRMRRLAVRRAERATGREMTVGNGSVETGRTVPDGRTGVVTYRFTWTNFANRTDGDLVVGDAIRGLAVESGTVLTITWPEELKRTSVSPPPDETGTGMVRWEEPLGARNDPLRVELAGGGGLPLVVIVGAVAVAGSLLGGWYARRRWFPAGDGPDAVEGADDGESEASDGIDEELLTDEERVLRLLEREGGRMKQQDLLAAVEWSRTKTSDVVNEMHEDGQIEVYRLGRENVLALPGEIDV